MHCWKRGVEQHPCAYQRAARVRRGEIQLDLNRHCRTPDGAGRWKEVLLRRLLPSHERDTCSHVLKMQLLEVKMLDDIVCSINDESFPPQQHRQQQPTPVATCPGRPIPARPSLSILMNLSTPSSPQFARRRCTHSISSKRCQQAPPM